MLTTATFFHLVQKRKMDEDTGVGLLPVNTFLELYFLTDKLLKIMQGGKSKKKLSGNIIKQTKNNKTKIRLCLQRYYLWIWRSLRCSQILTLFQWQNSQSRLLRLSSCWFQREQMWPPVVLEHLSPCPQESRSTTPSTETCRPRQYLQQTSHQRWHCHNIHSKSLSDATFLKVPQRLNMLPLLFSLKLSQTSGIDCLKLNNTRH